MSDAKRFTAWFTGEFRGLKADPYGDLVLFTDYDALAAELALAREGRWPQIADVLNDREARIAELRAELAQEKELARAWFKENATGRLDRRHA